MTPDEDNIPNRDLIGNDPAEPSNVTQPQPRDEAPERSIEEEIVESFGPYDDKRQRMYEKARQLREEQEAEAGIRALPDDVERSRVPPGTETFADRESRRLNGEPDPVERIETRVRVTVQGQDRELTQEELIANAQKALAAEGILEEAKQVRANYQRALEELNAAAAANQSGQQAQPQRTSAGQPEDTKPGVADLDAVVEAIQLGGIDEAKEALAKYGEVIIRQAMDRIGNIDEHISQREIQSRIDRQIVDEATSFEAENAEFSRPETQKYLAIESYQVMEDHLIKAGVRPDLLDAIMRRDGVTRSEAVTFAYRMGIANGVQLPTYRQVLDTAATRVRSAFNLPRNPAPQRDPARQASFANERDQRKLATATQPIRSSVQPGMQTVQKSEDERRREAVLERRMYLKGRR